MKKFDYNRTVAGVEEKLRRIENPETGVEESERLIDEARKDLDACYEYLRSEREKEEK